MTFPSAIGGVPYPEDLAPSIVFAVAYGCLLPFIAYRILNRKSVTTILIGSCIFAIGRIVTFSLRASQAANESKRLSLGLTSFIQADLALGYIGIASDLTNMLRTLLVTSTYGRDTYVQSCEAGSRYRFWISSAKLSDKEEALIDEKFPGMPPEGTPDLPHIRRRIRIITGLMLLVFIAASVTGGTASGNFQNVVRGKTSTSYVMTLRYVSTGIALALTLCIVAISVWGYFSLSRVNKRGCVIIFSIAIMMCVIAIYRLCLMHNTTESIQSTAPGSLNSRTDKALFYVFHVLPEWFSMTLLFVLFNSRREFSTGMAGDWRSHDETPKELKKRLEQEEKHRNKLIARGELKAPEEVRIEEEHIDKRKPQEPPAPVELPIEHFK